MSTVFQIVGTPGMVPLSLDEVKGYLRVDFDDDDNLLLRLIKAAAHETERITHRMLAPTPLICIHTLERPKGGELSGPLSRGPNWYQYQEELGANPFGAAMFYLDLPMPPCSAVTLVETKVTVWDAWATFTGLTYLDNVQEPARMYFQIPVTANQWRFTYTAGYDGVNLVLPEDLKQILFALIAFYYDHREGDALPDGLMSDLLRFRVDWL